MRRVFEKPQTNNYQEAYKELLEEEDEFKALREMLMSTKSEIDKVVGSDKGEGGQKTCLVGAAYQGSSGIQGR